MMKVRSALGWLSMAAWIGGLGWAVSGRAAELRCEPRQDAWEWSVFHGETKLMTYRSDPRQFKPYVRELCTIRGENLLIDGPKDHLHHHGLMYAIRVNGLNFWEEVSGNGVEKPIETMPPELGKSADGHAAATIRQTICWLAPQDAFLPDARRVALLIEHRTLLLTVDESREEVALDWKSEFEVGGKTNLVALTGSTYFGLGARFIEDLDAVARHVNSDGGPDLTGTKQDVTAHEWCAVLFDRPAGPATYALFGQPGNARGKPTYFTMKRPFAYISATQGLDKEPLVYKAGDKFRVEYLVTVYPAIKSAEDLNRRAAEWNGTRR